MEIRGTPPFSNAGPSEVLARVTYRYIAMMWRRSKTKWYYPAFEIALLAQRWQDRDPPIGLAFWLLSFSAAIKRDMTTSQFLRGVVDRSRSGYGFRRCALFEYKANRRDGPRVTNRGAVSDGEGSDNGQQG